MAPFGEPRAVPPFSAEHAWPCRTARRPYRPDSDGPRARIRGTLVVSGQRLVKSDQWCRRGATRHRLLLRIECRPSSLRAMIG